MAYNIALPQLAFITALDFLHIEKPLPKPILIKKGYYITNNTKHFDELLTKENSKNIGRLEYNHLRSGRPVIYSKKHLSNPRQTDEALLGFLREVQGILFKIWLWKDNSVNCQLAFALGINFELTSSNCLPVFNSCSTGEDKVLLVSQKDLEQVFGEDSFEIHAISEENMPKNTALTKSLGRLTVANYHVQAARNQRDLGFKIASYCSFFETLFSTDSVELSHQLSQRISFFMNIQPKKRLRDYTIMKRSYSIRSKTVHGDLLDSKKSELTEISRHCDDLARACLRKISDSEELTHLFDQGTRREISEFLTSMLFGVE